MNLESISNGLGAPSLLLLLMALRREIPATVSISADTGWENDRLWNTGRRSTNQEYFDQVIVPLCRGSHVTPRFVRAVDKGGVPRMPLGEAVTANAARGKLFGVPMFGSKGGRGMQSCTDKMKIAAVRQEARRLGATTNCNAQGIHFLEADRRVKGRFLRFAGWSIYQTTTTYKEAGVKKHRDIKWQTHYYPLVDLRMSRADVYTAVEKEGIPYIVSSECDLCPHKDLARWERTSPEVIEDGARIEALFRGEYFFTDRRIPLKDAIAAMQRDREAMKDRTIQQDLDFGCGNAICGV